MNGARRPASLPRYRKGGAGRRRRAAMWAIFGSAAGLVSSFALPASATHSDSQLWSTAVVNYQVNDSLTLSFTGRLRFDDDVTRTEDLLLGPSVTLATAPNVSVGAGYNHIHDYRPDSDNENRFWQALTLRHRSAGPALSSRFRLDERLVQGVDKPIFRARYRLRGTYDLNWHRWYAAASDEVFANLNSDDGGPKSGFSENRLYGGLGRPLGERFAIELGYQWGYKNRRGENLVTHALLATLTLNLGGP